MTTEGEQAEHRRLAVDLFNHVWTLIEAEDRGPREVDEMIHAAHASRYHWGVAGTPLHCARGEWQISRVYAVLGRGEPASWHARRYLEFCESNECSAFDKGFAHESMSRAAAHLGNVDECAEHIRKARLISSDIDNEEDRNYLLSELATISG
ncbi:MAG: hypothetical protein VX519_09780 [Myxococcota bacterium]|nr:hypothetical protein [Myxococcota bacterium]